LIVVFDRKLLHYINYKLLQLRICVFKTRVSCVIISFGKYSLNYLYILCIQCIGFHKKKFFLMGLLSPDSGQNVFPYCRTIQISILCAPICIYVYYFDFSD